ncbi:protein NRDE2-like protein [Leptotrombidium deliense]|uniref:Protein NRDE2-like protein n=1 Tax=Leptotrombidium deliense TaxID=299467 RepID=A0A443SDJ0_9ACAR|nr:protein NRDE2-like protein [Leptotrombidium deliense]
MFSNFDNSESNEEKQQSTLFPIISNSSNSNASNTTHSLQWLTNESYEKKPEEKQFSPESEHKQLSRKRSSKNETGNKRTPSQKPSKEIQISSKHVFLEDTGLPPQHAFRIDSKCDRNNLAFPSLYYLYVANYDKTKTLKSAKLNERVKRIVKPIRFYEDKSLRNESETSEFILGTNSTPFGAFVPLNSIRVSQSNRLYSVYDYATSQYVQGKGIPVAENNREELKFSSLKPCSSVGKGPHNLTRKQFVYNKTQELNKHLKDNPSDIDKWLELISFQEEFFNSHQSDIKDVEKTSEVQILEKKLSIVEKALQHNPKNTILNITRLETLKKIWEPAKVIEEWKKLSFIYPNEPLIWQQYINFLQSNISCFSFQAVVKVYVKCISTYSKMLEGFFQTHKPPANLEDELLKIVLMYCEFLRQCGYSEKAFASWQALIEFNIFKPAVLTDIQPLKEWLQYFEAFWDSGLPRFGEDNALGWAVAANTANFSSCFDSQDLSILEDSIINKHLSRSETWLDLEELRESYHWLPVRTIDDADCDDVDRSIFFDDIESILFRLKSPDSKLKLIEHFFTFLRAADTMTLLPIFFISEIEHFIPQFDTCTKLSKSTEKHEQYKFTVNCFNQAINVYPRNTSLRKHFISFLIKNIEKHTSFEKVKESIEEIVKQDIFRNDLFFWKCFAEIESLNGNFCEAKKLFETTIMTFVDIDRKSEFYSFIISFIKHMLMFSSPNEENKMELANNRVILRTVFGGLLGKSVEEINALHVLKVKRLLQISDGKEDEITMNCVILQALIYYLDLNLDDAMLTFENFLSTSKRGVVERTIFENYSQLLYFDSRKNFKTFSSLRNILHRALTQYPTSHTLLNLFIDVEMKSSLSINIRRIRSLFEKAVSSQDSENSLLLWRLFLKFEVDFGKRETALSVFYRFIQCCPFSKIVYKDGIRYFGANFQDIFDVMNEKEIKVRTPVEEVDLLMESYNGTKLDDQQDVS